MQSPDFKGQSDDELREFALLNPVAEWPLGFVRELYRRDYQPISDRHDLIQVCEGGLRETLENVAERFSRLSADLAGVIPPMPVFKNLEIFSQAEILSVDETTELDRLGIASSQLEDALLSLELRLLLKSYLESSPVNARWSKAGVIAAFVAAGGAIAGLALQLVFSSL